MKSILFLAVLFLYCNFSNGQTGSIIFEINTDSFGYTNVTLLDKKDTVYYKEGVYYDTITNLKPKEYRIVVYSDKDSTTYSTEVEVYRNGYNFIEIDSWKSEYFEKTFKNNDSISDGSYYLPEIYSSLFYSAGVGLPDNNYTHNAFYFKGGFNVDFQLGRSPITMGFDIGLEYNQINYQSIDLLNPNILHDHQNLKYTSLFASYLIGVYVNDYKLMDLGIQYNLPLNTRLKQSNGNQTLSTKKVHQFGDLRAKAKIGFAYGFVYGEYRLLDFMKGVYPDTPKLNIGILINIPTVNNNQ